MNSFRIVLAFALALACPARTAAAPDDTLAATLTLSPHPATAVMIPDGFVDELVAGELDAPVNFDFMPDGRILVVEQQTARIRVVVPGAALQPPAMGTVGDVRILSVEDGLLGIAIDPRWPLKPYVYVHHVSAATPNIKVARFNVSGDLDFTGDGSLTLDSLSRRDVLVDLPNDQGLHNGGTIEFGPDDYLYVALGDDGVPCMAQDIHQLRGKILRLDVFGIPDGPGPVWPYALLAPADNPYRADADVRARLVWHRGLRNPWSFDFEPRTGVMAIADVGEASWEEVEIITGGGLNFGWPFFEGPDVFYPDCPSPDLTGLTAPAWAYDRFGPDAGFTVILGGIVFAADSVSRSFPPEYWGDVFLLDFVEGFLQRIESVDEDWQLAPEVAGQPAPHAWGSGFRFVPRMRFGRDGGLWYLQGTDLRRISNLGTVAVGDEAAAVVPLTLDLGVAPNPSAGLLHLTLRLGRDSAVDLAIHDVRGRVVRRIEAGTPLSAGAHRLAWDGRDSAGRSVAPGVYFVSLAAGGETATRRVLRIRG